MGELPRSKTFQTMGLSGLQNPSVTAPCSSLAVNQSFCLATNEGWRSSPAGTQNPTLAPATTVSVTVPTTVTIPNTVTVPTTVTVPNTVTVPTTLSVATTV